MAGGGRDPGRVDDAEGAAQAGPAEVAAAVAAARRGQETWASLTPWEQRDGLRAVDGALVTAGPRIVEVVASETGKSPVDALETEVLPAAIHARYLARTAHLHLAPRRISPLPVAHKRAWLEYRPRGVEG